MKKRIAALFAAAALICGVSSCGGDKPAPTSKATEQTPAPTEAPVVTEKPAKEFTAKEVTDAVMAEVPIASAYEKSKDSLEDYFFKLSIDDIEDFSFVICASGMSPDEIAFFKMKSEDAAKDAKKPLKDRLEEQTETYTDYTPEEVFKLDDAEVKQSGVYVYYIVSADNERANEIVEDFIG